MNIIIDLINKAIENKNIITFVYNSYDRTVEPHHYGVLNNKHQLQAYQIEGASKGGNPIGWKNFKLEKIKKLSLSSLTFEVRSDHHPLNSKYSEIKKSVDKII
jgi:hypothetical protein